MRTITRRACIWCVRPPPRPIGLHAVFTADRAQRSAGVAVPLTTTRHTTTRPPGSRRSSWPQVSRGFCRVSVGGGLMTLLTRNDFFGEESLLNDTPSSKTISTITQVEP